MKGAGALEKLRLDFTGAWPLREVMPETDDATHHDIIRQLFCLITIATEDAAALAAEGQAKGLSPDRARAAADNLRELGARIECLSSVITELITEVGKGDATV